MAVNPLWRAARKGVGALVVLAMLAPVLAGSGIVGALGAFGGDEFERALAASLCLPSSFEGSGQSPKSPHDRSANLLCHAGCIMCGMVPVPRSPNVVAFEAPFPAVGVGRDIPVLLAASDEPSAHRARAPPDSA